MRLATPLRVPKETILLNDGQVVVNVPNLCVEGCGGFGVGAGGGGGGV